MKQIKNLSGGEILVGKEILIYKEFLELEAFCNKKGSKYDFNSVIHLLYLINDPRSTYSTYSEEDRLESSFDATGVDRSIESLDVFKKASDRYIKEAIEMSPSLSSLRVFGEMLSTAKRAAKTITAVLNRKIDQVEDCMKSNIDVDPKDTAAIIKDISNITDLSTKIPGLINQLKTIELQVAKETEGDIEAKGDKEAGILGIEIT